MRWRRAIKSVLIFALLGAIANLAVAWAIAYCTPMPGQLGGGFAKMPWGIQPPAGFPAHAMSDSRWLGFGVERIDQHAAANTSEAIAQGRAQAEAARPATPANAVVMNMGLDHQFIENEKANYSAYITRVGWPFLAFEGARFEHRVFDGKTLPNVAVAWAIEPRGNTVAGMTGTYQRLLPIRPIFPESVVNGMLYGIALWLLYFIPVTLVGMRRRRRRREGLCLACGYDLRGVAHERCPECGAAIQST